MLTKGNPLRLKLMLHKVRLDFYPELNSGLLVTFT